ncbi:hypothetical protein AAVH_32738 [Aphelenchoides avenae]|nr:hypothetical protein AAVH_32738 [Aphelenchus avenae]
MTKSATSLFLGTLLLVVVQLVWVGTHEISKYILTDLRFKRPIFMSFVRSSMWACCLLLYVWRSRSEVKKQRKSWRDVLFYLVYFAPPDCIRWLGSDQSVLIDGRDVVF